MRFRQWAGENLRISLEPEQERLFVQARARHILRYLGWMALVIIAVQVFNLAHALIYTQGRLHTQSSRVYCALYAVMLVVSLVAALLARHLSKRLPERARRVVALQKGYAFFLLLWSLAVTVYDQRVGNAVYPYLITLLSVAVLVQMPPAQAAGVFGGVQVLFMALLPLYQRPPQDNYGVFVNTSVMALIAIFISVYNHVNTRAQFRDRQLILSQSRDIAQKNRQLAQLAQRDSLTGLENRRFLDDPLPALFADCVRRQRPMTVLMMDIDDFKRYNDRYGHQMGDACLRQVAQALLACREPGGHLIRYGGEEFLYIAADQSLEQAQDLAQRMRRAVEGLQIPHDGAQRARLTVSIGVNVEVPQPDQNQWELFRHADRALYRAKGQGKNQVVSFSVP
ncbi:MAG: GGDEF domain-containing protein [Christensenellales bacterium]|jgi:diguanylate cyclase (GGDEF)-like protein